MGKVLCEVAGISEMTGGEARDRREHVLALARSHGGVRPVGGEPWKGKKPAGRVFRDGEALEALESLNNGGFSLV